MTEATISQASCPLKVSIIGSGLVGLAAAWRLASSGHKVDVYERKESLNKGGSDIQIAPNGVKLFEQLGLKALLEEIGDAKNGAIIYDHFNLNVVARLPLDPGLTSHSIMIRRDDLIETLFREATEAGANVHFNSHMAGYDDSRKSIQFEDGSEVTSDLIIGADGVRSSLRKFMFPDKNTYPVATNEVCFQFNLPYEHFADDAEALRFWEDGKDNLLVVTAEGNYLAAWTLEARNEFFMIFSEQRYDKPVEIGDWSRDGDMDEVRRLYSHYPDVIVRLLDKYKGHCERWRIVDAVTGAGWYSKSGQAVLLGDAIHAMPPHASQGFEDVAALGEIVDRVESTAGLSVATRVLEAIRHDRTQKAVAFSKANLRTFTLPDGPATEARDARLKAMKVDDAAVAAYNEYPLDPNANASDPSFLKWIQSYDIIGTVREYLAKNPLPA